MSSMESLDKLQAELSVNVYGEAFHTLYKLSQDVNVEHAELMAQAMRYVRKEKVEPLEAENAKLRELVDILCFCMQFNRDCDDCKLNGAEGKLNIEACEGLRMLLQDAGIEVPE